MRKTKISFAYENDSGRYPHFVDNKPNGAPVLAFGFFAQFVCEKEEVFLASIKKKSKWYKEILVIRYEIIDEAQYPSKAGAQTVFGAKQQAFTKILILSDSNKSAMSKSAIRDRKQTFGYICP